MEALGPPRGRRAVGCRHDQRLLGVELPWACSAASDTFNPTDWSWDMRRRLETLREKPGCSDRMSAFPSWGRTVTNAVLHFKVFHFTPRPGETESNHGVACEGTREGARAARHGPQERDILSGGMNPVSPRALSATRPSGRTTRWVMLPLLRDRRSQPSGGNCSARHTM